MRVTRSTTFQRSDKTWEKIEIELDSSDLLPEELLVPDHVKAQLLELRIDKHIVMHLLRNSVLTQEESASRIAELDGYRASLLKMKAPPVLRKRGITDDQ